MDGNRDRPPGKTAENWSRRDGIRAGAVSGPWRSAPRADELPGFVAIPAPEPARSTSGAGGSASVWVAGAFIAAAGLAAGLYFLDPGPEGEIEAVVPAAGEQAPPAAGTEAPPEPTGAPAPVVAPLGAVRLRVGPAVPPERQEAILAALAAAGYSDVEVEELGFQVGSSRVGYFSLADRPAAEALSRAIGSAVGEGIGVRDYSALQADPVPGRLDLWVAG